MPKQPPVVLREKPVPKRRYTVFGLDAGRLGSDYVSACGLKNALAIVNDQRPAGYVVYCVFSGYVKPLFTSGMELFVPAGHKLSAGQDEAILPTVISDKLVMEDDMKALEEDAEDMFKAMDVDDLW